MAELGQVQCSQIRTGFPDCCGRVRSEHALVLSKQQIEGGGSEAIVLGGMLDLCPLALKNQFSLVEQDICLIQRRVGLDQLEDNVEL
jgi:hypothetical protein